MNSLAALAFMTFPSVFCFLLLYLHANITATVARVMDTITMVTPTATRMYITVATRSFPLDVLPSTPIFVTDIEVFGVCVEIEECSHGDSKIVVFDVILLTLSSVLVSSDGTCTALVAFIGMCEDCVCAMDKDGVSSVGDILWLLTASVGNTLRLLVVYVRVVVCVAIGALSSSDPPAAAPVESE